MGRTHLFILTLPSKQSLLKTLELNPDKPVPDSLNLTFHSVDKELANLAGERGSSSGCTAAVAFLRLEEESGKAVKPGEEAAAGPSQAAGEASGREQATERTSSDGLWSRISKRFDSSDSKTKPSLSASSARRVLYTANVGDARAVLW